MDDKSAQAFGFFLGLLLSVVVYALVSWFLDLSTTVEYIILGISVVIFSIIGIVMTRVWTKDRTLPPMDIPVTANQQNPNQPTQKQVVQTQQPQQVQQPKTIQTQQQRKSTKPQNPNPFPTQK